MMQQENNIQELLNRIKKAKVTSSDNDKHIKSNHIPCLSKEYLFAKEYQEVTERHKSMLYKQMNADERYKYDCRLEEKIKIVREEYRRMRMPPLSNEELEKYLGPYGG